MKSRLVIFILTLYFTAYGQQRQNVISFTDVEFTEPIEKFLFSPDLQQLRTSLSDAPRADESGQAWIRMSLPLADGSYHEVEVAEASVVAESIHSRYPQNRSYKVRGVNDQYISGRMALTANGLTALLYTKDGHVFIERENAEMHKSYYYDGAIFDSFSCGTVHTQYKGPKKASGERDSYGSTTREYRIAIASTGEFSAKHGNNLANINAAITEYLTLLNTLYERDLAITFELIASNDDIIFFDPNTDGLNPSNNSTKLSSAQSVINAEIGSANYDIGHVFYEMNPPSSGWWGSGVASLGVVCSSSSKARGWSGCGGSYPNSFWMGIFAHEVGHQFAATHTFYGTAGNCGGSQRSVGNGVEPGSGNSLMSYEGSCGAGGGCTSQNITPESGFQYFHSHSIDQIQSFVSGSGGCYTSISSGNSPPSITMPSNTTIPKETPFVLTATVNDSDGDPLLFSWEEVDTDNLSLSCPNGAPNDAATSTTAPLFRSFDPSAGGNTRYFPQMSDILDDTQTMGEILPEVGRTIDMRFSARGTDANGVSGISYEDMTVTVAGNAGPFSVTTANSPTAYTAGQTVNIVWTVNNTNIAPVLCSNVNILFSTDGGNTFPITLASNVSNDGSHSVTMPGSATDVGRIKIEAVGNIFFAINKGDITIISDCEPAASQILNDDDVTADAGDPYLNLGLQIGGSVPSVSGAISSSDPSSTLIANSSTSSSCTTVPTTPYYDTYVFEASEADSYTFSISGSFAEVVNIYADEYIIPVVNCQNWLACNTTYFPPSSVNISSSINLSLSAGDVIEMVVSGLNTGETGTYNVDFSSSGSGELMTYDVVPVGFVYKYVIYNSSGTVLAIEDEADLSDASTYTSGEYKVQGLMALSTVNLTPYIGNAFSTLESDVIFGTICGQLSGNDVTITINGCSPGIKMVTSPLDDGGPGTLRYVVDNACSGDLIQFGAELLNSTIVLSSEIIVDEDLIIDGLGKNNLTFSGNDSNRIFRIEPGATASITNLTLANGYSASSGGAFVNNGDVQLSNVKLSGNKNGLISKAFTNLGTITIAGSVDVEE